PTPAATAGLDDIDEQADRMRKLRDGRAYLTSELGKLPGVSVTPSEGNFVLVDLGGARMSSDALVDALSDRGIFVRKLATHHGGRTAIRITIGTAEQNARCLRVISQLLLPALAVTEAALPADAE